MRQHLMRPLSVANPQSAGRGQCALLATPLAMRPRMFAKPAKDGSLVAVTHFNFPGIGRLRQADKGWQWLPLDYSSQVR